MKITKEHIKEADRFILKIITQKDIPLGEQSCKILMDAKLAWTKYLATIDHKESEQYFYEFGDRLKELFTCDEVYNDILNQKGGCDGRKSNQ